MNAIITKFHSPGTVRGSRISATDHEGNRVIIDNPQDVNWQEGENHAVAARKLARKIGWAGTLLRWPIKNGSWVFIPEAAFRTRV